MATRRLVLLANQYPFLIGDHVFVASEIPALAAQFDEVVVFNYAPGEPSGLADLPDNVRYGGSLFGIPRADKIKALLSPRTLVTLGSVGLLEARRGRLTGHFRTFLAGAIAGFGLAGDARLKRALYEDGVDTSVYSFWGMGIGMLVPWIRPRVSSVNIRLHRYDLYEEEAGYLPFRPALFRRSDRILAISESARHYLLEKYPRENLNEKIFVRRLGSAEPLDAGEKVLVGPGHTIVSCSYVIPVKRVELILDALKELPTDFSLKWIHFGGGALEEDLRVRAAQVERPGLSIEIRGATPHDQVIDFYGTHEISAFVNVSASEGVPVSIMEAISYGIPVIATDVGGTAEIVGDELETGELIPADFTAAELARKIMQVVTAAPGTYSPKETWARYYNADANAEATAALISD